MRKILLSNVLILCFVTVVKSQCVTNPSYSEQSLISNVSIGGLAGREYEFIYDMGNDEVPAVVQAAWPASLPASSSIYIVSPFVSSARLYLQNVITRAYPHRGFGCTGTAYNVWTQMANFRTSGSEAIPIVDFTLTGSSASFFEIVTHNSAGNYSYESIRLRDDVSFTSSSVTLTFSYRVGFSDNGDDFVKIGSDSYSVAIGQSNAVTTGDLSVTPSSVCNGYTGAATVSVVSGYEPTSAYRLYRPNGVFFGFFTGSSVTIPAGSMSLFLDGGTWKFDATEQETYTTEQAVKARLVIDKKAIPVLSAIAGSTSLCWNDNVKTYSVTGSAESYIWSATNGTVSGSGASVSVTWNQSASSWGLSVYGRNASAAGNCNGVSRSNTVTIAKDVQYFNTTGPSNICQGDDFTISLSGSRASTTYVLYRNGSPGTTTTGTGNAIGFGGLTSTGSYQVYQRTAACGDYPMNNTIGVSVFSTSSAPTVSGTDEYCSGDLVTLSASTTNTATNWEWEQYNGSSWSEVTSETTSTFTSVISNTSISSIRATYEDTNGCRSAPRAYPVEIVGAPSGYSITGENDVCIGDYTHTYTAVGTAEEWSWTATNGTVNSSSGNTASITWDETKSTHTVRLTGINNSAGDAANCSGSQATRSVTVRDDINFYAVTGEDVCWNETGTIRIADSQSGYNYFLYNGSDDQVGSVRPGTGNAITWTALGDDTYSVELVHPTCGTYAMGTADINIGTRASPPSISGTDEWCEGATVTLNGTTGNATSGWNWQRYNGSSWSTVSSESSSVFTAPLTDDITIVRGAYYDSDGCLSNYREYNVEIVSAPTGYSISGENDVCINSYTHIYTVSGSADEWNWSATNGTVNSTTASTATITWDETQSSHTVRLTGTNNSSSDIANCTGGQQTFNVTVRDDINFYAVTGEDVCWNETGTIRIADSQVGYNYFLYDGGDDQVGSVRPGTGNAITWTGLGDDTYSVELVHPTCGTYAVGSADIVVRSRSSAPSISGTDEWCEIQTVLLNASTGNATTSWVWEEWNGATWSLISGESSSAFSASLGDDITKVRAGYNDSDGCLSNYREYDLEIVSAPTGYSISGENDVCVNAYTHIYTVSGSADEWSWTATNGTVNSTTASTATITWDETQSSHTVRIRGTNNSSSDIANCIGSEETFSVTLRTDVDFYEVSGSFVCIGDEGTITLDDSQSMVGYIYYLYNGSGSQVSDTKTGSGSSLVWSELDPDTYTVRLYHGAKCGFYEMGSADVTEYAQPSAPNLAGDSEYCLSDAIVVSASTSNNDDSWLWEQWNGTTWSLVADQTSSVFSKVIGNSDITELRASYYNENGCISSIREFDIEIVTPPSGYSISGENDVCVNAYTHTYTVSGSADDWYWSVTDGTGTINSTSGNTASITWDETESGHGVSVYGSFDSSTEGIKCDGIEIDYDVVLRDDVEFFDLSGSTLVCVDDKGSVSLSSSENSKIYALLVDGVRSTRPVDIKVGTGALIEWTDLDVDNMYTVQLETVDCGNYLMNNNVAISEYPKSPAPFITSSLVRCGPGTYELQVGSPLAASQFIYYDKIGASYNELSRSPSSTANINVSSSNNDFAVSYIDPNGCESFILDFEVSIQAIPQVTFESNITICEYDNGVAINDFLASSFPSNTEYIASGEIVSNNKLFPVLVAEYDRNYSVEYVLINDNGCSNSYNFNVYISSTPEVVLSETSIEVCNQLSVFDLSSNVSDNNGHSVTFEIDGVGVSSTIDPSAYSAGEYTVTAIIENGESCLNSIDYMLTVTEPYDIDLSIEDLNYCPGVGSFDVASAFDGFEGSYQVNGINLVSSTIVNVGNQVSIGDNTLIFTEDSECGTVHNFTIHVFPLVTYTVDENVTVCTGDNLLNLNNLISENVDGDWSGGFVSGDNFNQLNSGPGNFQAVYDHTDENGCDYSYTVDIQVLQSPAPFFSLQQEVCANDDAILLEANPPGGFFTGDIVTFDGSNYYVTPTVSLTGTNQQVTYTYSAPNTCEVSVSRIIGVKDFPTISFQADVVICADEDLVDMDNFVITPDLSGGTQVWSGSTISNGKFIRSLAGTEDTFYTADLLFQDNNGCLNEATLTFFYSSTPLIDFVEEEVTVCNDELRYDLIENVLNIENHDVTFEVDGDPVVLSDINLNDYAAALYNITVNIENSQGCINAQSYSLRIEEPGTLDITNDDLEFCANVSTAGINLSEIFDGYDGTFRVNGALEDDNIVSLGVELSEGSNQLIYIEGNECQTEHIRTLTVHPAPTFTVDEYLKICTGDGKFLLNSLLSDGSYVGSWKGSFVNDNEFDPLASGEGSGFEVRFEYTDGNGCLYVFNVTIDVFQTSSPFFNIPPEVCGDDDRILLKGNFDGGDFSGVGVELDGSNWYFNPDPSMAEQTVNITFSYVNGNECESSYEESVYVKGNPIITFEENVVLCAENGSVDLSQFVVSPDLDDGIYTFEGEAISAGKFVPSLASGDDQNYTAGFTYTSENGCTSTGDFTFYFSSTPSIGLVSYDVAVCVEDGIFNMASNVLNNDDHILTYSIGGTPLTGSSIQLGQFFYSPGSYVVTVETESAIGCYSETEYNLVIEEFNEIVLNQDDITYCPYFASIDLNQLFAPHTGTIRLNSQVVPDGILYETSGLWSEGNNELRFTENQTCEQDQIYNLYIEHTPVLDIGSTMIVCQEDGDIDLSFIDKTETESIDPVGGEWSGPFVNRGKFQAGTSGPGEFDLLYTYQVGECQFSRGKKIVVNATPYVYAGPDHAVCRNGAKIQLMNFVNVPGGDWSGSEAINEAFEYDPTLENANSNVVILTYSFKDGNTCVSSDDIRVVLNEPPFITPSISSYTFCINEAPYDISQDIKEFDVSITSEKGISNGILYPSIMEEGNHLIRLSRSNSTNCETIMEIPVTIVPTQELILENFKLCVDAGLVDLFNYVNIPNGEFSGPSVEDARYINTAKSIIGDNQITYTVSGDNACTLVGVMNVEVNPLPDDIIVPEIITSCYSDSDVLIQVGNPSIKYSYEWHKENGTSIGIGESISVSNELGSYYVIATSNDACSIQSSLVEIKTEDFDGEILIAPFNGHVVSGEVVTFSSTIDAASYTWYLSNTVRQNKPSTAMVYNYPDTTITVTLEVESELGCVKTFERTFEVKDDNGVYNTEQEGENGGAEGSDELSTITSNQVEIILYPNPTIDGKVNLKITSTKKESARIVVYNSVTQKVLDETHQLEVGINEPIQLQIPENVNGIYFISISTSVIKEMIPGIKTK